MPFDWQKLVQVARLLERAAGTGEGDAEAMFRSVIGRAYYGAFGHARKYAVDYLGYDVRGFGDDHGALRAHLKKKRRSGDAQRLDSLRQWRNDADYSDDLPWNPKTVAAEAIKQAEKVLNSLAPPSTSDK